MMLESQHDIKITKSQIGLHYIGFGDFHYRKPGKFADLVPNFGENSPLTAQVRLEGADRVCGIAFVKAANANTSLGATTSDTAKILNVSKKCVAGMQRRGKFGIVKMSK